MLTEYTSNPIDLNMNADLNLRAHMYATIYGTANERPRGRWFVIQKLVRDSDGMPVQSPYSYKVTGEGKFRERGPNTTRTGYLCNEVLVRGLSKPATKMIMDEITGETGNQVPTRDVIYLAYEEATKDIAEKDVIVFIALDDDGSVINPVTRTKECNLTKRYEKCSDNGRIEYFACIMEDQK